MIDGQWTYGDTQRITVDRPIAKAELIRPAAVTHSSDPNQRFVDLPMTVDGNNIDLNVTSNPNLAPPGWYMLFAVDANGIPSVAQWVHLGGPARRVRGSAVGARPRLRGRAWRGAEDAAEEAELGPGEPADRGLRPALRDGRSLRPDGLPAEVKATTTARCEWLAGA